MYRWANSCTIALLITIRKAVQARMYLGGTFSVVLMYNVCTCLYNVCTRLYNVCTCATHVNVYTLYVHVYTLYVHVYTRFTTLTSCLNRFSWLSQRCRCPSALLCKGQWGWGQSLSGRWWFFWCHVRCCRNRGGHQQVYQWLGEPGASWFWQTAFIAKQAACSCRHNWQQDVALCSIGRRLSSHYGWGTAEKVYAFRAPIVQARSGIQVNEHNIHIHVYTMYMYLPWQVCRRTYMICTSYILCTYMTYTLYIHLHLTDISYNVTQMDSRRAQKIYCYAARPCILF